MFRAALFDVDGTLIDTVDLHTEAWREAFLAFGKDVPFQEIRSQIGKGGDQLLPVFWGEDELKEIEEPLSKHRSELFKAKFLPRVKAFPKVRELFLRLRQEGKQIALASSAAGEELEAYKKISHIEDLIEAETSKDDAEKSKPYPDIFEAALARLGNPDPAECVVIGDTPYDIEAAHKAGVVTIGVRSGGFSEESLSGAIALYDGPADLLEHYAQSPFAA